MNMNKKLWGSIGILVLLALLVGGYYLMLPSAEDILVQTLDTTKTITAGHAVVAFDVDTIEQDGSATIEVWGRHVEDGSGSFRLEVLEASEDKAVGAIIVSDGETLWAYSPSENKVFVGTLADAQALMENNEFMPGEYGQFFEGMEGLPMDGDYEHPENAEDAVAELLTYVTADKSGTETVAGETATLLVLQPIPEQMPAEYSAVGGLINLWIGKDSNLPLAAAYTGGSFGEFSITATQLEINIEMDDTLFTFEVPEGAEVITFADLEPQSLSLEEADGAVDFEFLTPAETPEGATLVDVLEIQGALVQRYTFADGGSFTIAQGIAGEHGNEGQTPAVDSAPVDVRGTTGQLFEDADSGKVLLTWTEGDLFFSVAGDLTVEQALAIAESLQ